MQNSTGFANAPRTVSPYLVDAWRRGGVASGTSVPSRIATGDSLTLVGGETGVWTNPGCITLNGTNQNLLPSTAGKHDLKAGQSGILVFRLARDTVGAADTLLHSGDSTGLGGGYKVSIDATENLLVSFGTDIAQNITVAAAVNDLVPRQLISTFDVGVAHKAYLNGTFVGQNTTHVASAAVGGAAQALRIGCRSDDNQDAAFRFFEYQLYRITGALPSNIAEIVNFLATHPYQLLPSSVWGVADA